MTVTHSSDVTDAQRAEGKRAYELDRQHVFHSWAAQEPFNPMTVVKTQDSFVWDETGKRYIDFSSQMVNTNIGHQHPKVVAAIQEQAATIATIAPAHVSAPRSEAARLIAERAPQGMDYVFFTNGGADANEHAIRMARLHTGKTKVLSAYRSYHGGTHLAVNVTGDPRRFASDTASTGTVHFLPCYPYRSYFHAENEEQEVARALENLENTIVLEGPSTIAALILESVPGTAGIYVPPPGYLAGVRELTKKYGIVFIADEVMSGFGRTGEWFAIDHWDVTPDLITFAKGVNSGYVPLGGVVINEAIYDTFRNRVYPGGLTYSGHPLATAAAVATINAMEDEGMNANATRLGNEVIGPGLQRLQEAHPSVGDVRGLGCFWAIELVTNRETKEPLAPYGSSSEAMGKVIAKCKELGLIVFANFNRIHVVPPLNTDDEIVTEGLAILDEALSVADQYYQH